MLKFKLDNRKAIEAAAILAGLSPGRKIGRKRLLALLYIASRECLKKSGRPLLGGSLVAMRYGPVHSGVLDLINEKDGEAAEWARHFHNDGFYVTLDEDPGVNSLSRFESRVLADTLKKHEDVEDFDLARLTHKFSEYVVNYQKGRGRRITLEQLVQAVGGLSPIAHSVLRDLKEKDEADEMFANAEKAAQNN